VNRHGCQAVAAWAASRDFMILIV